MYADFEAILENHVVKIILINLTQEKLINTHPLGFVHIVNLLTVILIIPLSSIVVKTAQKFFVIMLLMKQRDYITCLLKKKGRFN